MKKWIKAVLVGAGAFAVVAGIAAIVCVGHYVGFPVDDGVQILHLLQDLFFVGVVNASGNIMEPMHALRTGAAICPAVKVKGVAGNTALGKTFQGRQVCRDPQ